MTLTDYRERLALSERIDKEVKTTIAWLGRSEHWLGAGLEELGVQQLPVFWDLLDKMLDLSAELVERFPDEFFQTTELGDPWGIVSALGGDPLRKHSQSDDPLAAAEKVVALLKERRARVDVLRRILALETTDGRTPEEAQMYHEKAAQLRAQHGFPTRAAS